MTFQPAGNYYDKYHTQNPIARKLMDGFMRSFDQLVSASGVTTSAFEMGCGEGELSIRLARRGLRVSGVDIAADAIMEARTRVKAAGVDVALGTGSIYELDAAAYRSDLVVCCEVLEHLDDTQAALAKLHALCGNRLIASVPREPLWRAMNMARGKYLSDLGNTPGHVQHWSRNRFLEVLSSRFRVLQVRSPLPWTMALCEPLK
jgi:2-polyprenyl-3-methyl-5-hydroxy-6-metoxy-1,4-benzoquinol methylase